MPPVAAPGSRGRGPAPPLPAPVSRTPNRDALARLVAALEPLFGPEGKIGRNNSNRYFRQIGKKRTHELRLAYIAAVERLAQPVPPPRDRLRIPTSDGSRR